jgi:hypothetical protein
MSHQSESKVVTDPHILLFVVFLNCHSLNGRWKVMLPDQNLGAKPMLLERTLGERIITALAVVWSVQELSSWKDQGSNLAPA